LIFDLKQLRKVNNSLDPVPSTNRAIWANIPRLRLSVILVLIVMWVMQDQLALTRDGSEFEFSQFMVDIELPSRD
jgi:hypothetical protein